MYLNSHTVEEVLVDSLLGQLNNAVVGILDLWVLLASWAMPGLCSFLESAMDLTASYQLAVDAAMWDHCRCWPMLTAYTVVTG